MSPTGEVLSDGDVKQDPTNPQNWSTLKKSYYTMAIALLGFSVTAGSSLITPATPEIALAFGVSETAAILPLTLYVLGLAWGPSIAAPISEHYGRTVVYKITAPMYLLFILGAGFSKTFPSLLICRFFAGWAGGPVLAVGTGTIADVWEPRNRAIASAMFVMMPFLGPSLGPVIGGFAAQYKGWQWTQWCTIIVGVACSIPIFTMSETYLKIIKKRQGKVEVLAEPRNEFKFFITVLIIRPLSMLVLEPTVTLFSLYTAFTFSVLFGLFSAYPYTFRMVYNFNTWQCGMTFIPIGLGVVLGVAVIGVIDRTLYLKKYRNGNTATPEDRLVAAQIGCFLVPIGLFWFAWTARPSVHWISPMLAGIPFAMGNIIIFCSAALYLIDTYGPLNGASSMAANGMARYTLGAVFPLFTVQMYQRLGIGWATSLLGFIAVALMPIPWLFSKYGPKIRKMSRYAIQAGK